jgi:predicted acyltransferase
MCFLFLAGFSWSTAATDHKIRWSVPLVVVGVNSIAAYLMAHLFEDFIRDSFRTHLSPRAFQILGAGLEPLVTGFAVLLIYWLLLFWMYRRKLFLRI